MRFFGENRWFRRGLQVVIVASALGLTAFGYLRIFHGYFPGDEALDTDHDGIVNGYDIDADGDGLSYALDPDADGDGLLNSEDVVHNARGLTGILYGGGRSIGARIGFLVCSDIPRLAYAQAGIPFAALIEQHYASHPAYYDTEGGHNTPASAFFLRRVRNFYAYFLATGTLISNCSTPKVGDIVFYGRSHCSLVVAVYPDGTVAEVETAGSLVFSTERRKRWIPKDVGRLVQGLGFYESFMGNKSEPRWTFIYAY